MEEQQRINSLLDSYDRLVEGQKHLLDIAIRERAITERIAGKLLQQLSK